MALKLNVMTPIQEIEFSTIDGETTTLAAYEGHTVLVVNVASECGMTTQYEGLQGLFEEYQERGFFVLGFPCNQFMDQEPGTNEEIKAFATGKYGVTFPLAGKVDVKGEAQHPLFRLLTEVPDAQGEGGEVTWNFEKFLISPQGEVVGRFRPKVEPRSEDLVSAIEKTLPA